jgi:hypothetical protein
MVHGNSFESGKKKKSCTDEFKASANTPARHLNAMSDNCTIGAYRAQFSALANTAANFHRLTARAEGTALCLSRDLGQWLNCRGAGSLSLKTMRIVRVLISRRATLCSSHWRLAFAGGSIGFMRGAAQRDRHEGHGLQPGE